MKVTILKSFPYAHDGNNTVMLHPGQEGCEVHDHLVPGLIAAGHIEPVDEERKALPQMAVPSVELALVPPENKMLTPPAEETKATTDTVPQRTRRKRQS